MKNSSSFFNNQDCKYFPCHSGIVPDRFNCIFCFCPLYFLGKECCGDFVYSKKGIKDCTDCKVPHLPENYEMIMAKLKTAIQQGRTLGKLKPDEVKEGLDETNLKENSLDENNLNQHRIPAGMPRRDDRHRSSAADNFNKPTEQGA